MSKAGTHFAFKFKFMDKKMQIYVKTLSILLQILVLISFTIFVPKTAFSESNSAEDCHRALLTELIDSKAIVSGFTSENGDLDEFVKTVDEKIIELNTLLANCENTAICPEDSIIALSISLLQTFRKS
ncbi:MAG: hypothetical protein KDD40_01820, partial [Bdellovibrionales bacterium]|nr:hypothetical protein [Bdellovibrionales bacterium]